ncbi:unnamed protein product [Clonostachys chloroleuca]|uniref:Muconate cycloisomerase 1 n=1 Tax=Clonostachys chloroleuca TaxID=1926264 RepID=A0AA35LW25_9HYPO|nr:unnamed protein product [Clonostachys chloroleuca]
MASIQTRTSGGSVHHLLSGSYTNRTLFLLAFDTVAKTLTLSNTVPGFGLHQYVTTNAARDRIYATAMSEPPQLFSWSVDENYQFEHLNTVNVTSSSCYFSDDGQYAFSAGGPTARIHKLDEDGSIADQVYEMLYVPEQEVPNVDKTRNSVLYGAHGFDVNVNKKGFVPHLAFNSIFMYDIADNGTAKLESINLSPTEGDGPRNSFPSKDGKLLYVVDMRGKFTYRSNTVQQSRDGQYLFTSTRGWNNTEANGWVAAFQLDKKGYLKKEQALTYYKAPLTLGSAAGLRVAFWEDETNADPKNLTDYMYLSDTSEGYMYILGWTPSTKTISEVASLQYPDNASPYEAVWLD